MDTRDLAGSVKAAILVQAMGEKVSQEIIGSFDDDERDLINDLISQIGPIAPDLVEKVAEEFTTLSARRGTVKNKRAPERNEEQKEGEDASDSDSQSKNLTILRSLDAEVLVGLVKDEHPQTIALILVHLDSEVASEILAGLDDEKKIDVAFRIASLDKVLSEMVEEVGRIFEELLKEKGGTTTQKMGGVGCLAEMLNQIEGSVAQMILDEIEETDPELVAEVKQKMFVFEDLVLVDDKGLQKLLRSVETNELATALKAASEEVREKIFRNMSERAAEMLQEEMEALGAVRMKEVEDAQQGMTRIIQDLEAKGELVISGRKGEEFVA